MEINKVDLRHLISVIENKNLSIAQAAELVRNSEKKSKIINTFNEKIKLMVDYRKTVEQLILFGDYDWKNYNITSAKFPNLLEVVGKIVERRMRLFQFNCDISSKNIISEMRDVDCYPATITELLFLGFLYPELQKKFPIIALNSIWLDASLYKCVPYLDFNDKGRGVDISCFDYEWNTSCCFLGVYS